MNTTSKNKYLTKSVVFAGKKITLYSLDGDTWSSRSDELELIKERHEQEKACYGGQIKGGPQSGIPSVRHKASSVKARYVQSLRVEPKVELKATPKIKAVKAKTNTSVKKNVNVPAGSDSVAASTGLSTAATEKGAGIKDSVSSGVAPKIKPTLPTKIKNAQVKGSATPPLPKPRVRGKVPKPAPVAVKVKARKQAKQAKG